MKSFLGQEPASFTNFGKFTGPYYRDTDRGVEYWHAGKLYRLASATRIDRFIELVSIQNKIEGADVAVGPAYNFFDEQSRRLDIPTLDQTIGHIGIYHAVGSPDDTYEIKKQAYKSRANAWDGVPQIAAATLAAEG